MNLIKWPLILIAIISVLFQILETQKDAEIIFNVLRVSFFVWAGWLAFSYKPTSLLWCALAGALMFLLSHVIIAGGFFLIQSEFKAFLGVILSYILFVTIPILLALTGGFVSKLNNAKNT